MRRLLLVHALAPPQGGGTGVVMHRLLEGLPGWRADVVADRALRRRVRAGEGNVVSGRYRFVLKLPPLPVVRPLIDLVNLPLAVLAGARAAAAARRSGARLVLTAFDGGFSQIAATVAARLSGLPLVVMVFDLWEENAYSPVERWLARRFERRILRSAAEVVVFCGAARDHLSDKHAVTATVIDTPIERLEAAEAGEPDPGEVLVAGAVYWAQEDAVRRLLRAVREVEGAHVTVLGDRGAAEAGGLEADRYEQPLSGAAFRARLMRAGVLFLGLSLESPHPEVVLTATPARLPEYMAAGRPLLVHAPAGSHAAEYARREDFAEVVDEPEVRALAAGLERVVSDPDTAARRARRARQLAARRHDAEVVRAAFARILDRVGDTGRP